MTNAARNSAREATNVAASDRSAPLPFDDGDGSGFHDDNAGDAADISADLNSGAPDAFDYCVLRPEDIVKAQQAAVSYVEETLQIPAPTARLLLQQFAWSKDRLLDSYCSMGEDTVYEQAHVANPNRIQPPCATPAPDAMIRCGICLTDCPVRDCFTLSCAHMFCRACCIDYLTHEVSPACPFVPSLYRSVTLSWHDGGAAAPRGVDPGWRANKSDSLSVERMQCPY